MSGYNEDDFDYSVSGSENEDDEDAMEMEDDNPPTDPATDRIVLTQESLQKEMNDLIVEVSQIIQISNGAIRILLQHSKWDKERLLEKFYECSNVDEFLRKEGVATDPLKMGEGVEGKQEECGICCNVAVLKGLNCRHFACSSCWEQYLNTKILVNNTSIIECLFPGCKLLVEDEYALSVIGQNETTRNAFTRLSINGFVACNPLLRWCPALDCGNAVKVSQPESRTVECLCKCRFCFECGLEGHEPVNCRLLKLWKQKCKDDSETSNWIVANTKDCPKCHTAIEKNGGCHHMTCNSSSCKYEFCWTCMAPWTKHGYDRGCGAYDGPKEESLNAQQQSRVALERYLHYYNRFVNHQKSLGFEEKLYATVQAKMEVMQQQNTMSWVEVQFLKTAVDTLTKCRRTLMYTYAFAFYLKKTNEKEIFEDNQSDLEVATEQLSEFLEKDLESENLVTLKQKVQDKYRYVDQRRDQLLKHCAEGAEKDVWIFTE